MLGELNILELIRSKLLPNWSRYYIVAKSRKGHTLSKILISFHKDLTEKHTHSTHLPNSQNVCKFTKSFLVCQIHFEVLKNVYIQGEVISDQFYHLKFIWFGVSVVHFGKKTSSFGIFFFEGGGGVPYSQK